MPGEVRPSAWKQLLDAAQPDVEPSALADKRILAFARKEASRTAMLWRGSMALAASVAAVAVIATVAQTSRDRGDDKVVAADAGPQPAASERLSLKFAAGGKDPDAEDIEALRALARRNDLCRGGETVTAHVQGAPVLAAGRRAAVAKALSSASGCPVEIDMGQAASGPDQVVIEVNPETASDRSAR
jgi:hypothetical protein